MGAAILGPASSGAQQPDRQALPPTTFLALCHLVRLSPRLCLSGSALSLPEPCSWLVVGRCPWILYSFTGKLFPEVGLKALLTRVIGPRGQTHAVIGGGPGLAEAGRGRKVSGTMAAMPPLRDRLSFLHRLPILLKGTSDDDVPCPGYLFEEIASILPCGYIWGPCSLSYLISQGPGLLLP